jgi:pimeloyl-ACP methyl ester carboxylesterase
VTDRAATIMLVHGAWHGSWCWELLRACLDRMGIDTIAVDNPSTTVPGADLHADVVNVRAALDATAAPVLLVGHSYGGAVISEAASHPSVARTVFLAAFALDPEETVGENALTGGEEGRLGEAMLFDGDTVSVDPALAGEFFYHDCSPDVAVAATSRLRPMSLAAMSARVQNAAWRDKPSTYIVCTDDRALPVALQRSCASRLRVVVDIASSHSPFLSRPDELALVLAGDAALAAS